MLLCRNDLINRDIVHMTSIKMQLIMAAQFLLSMVLGGMLGYEREMSFKSAGIRTFAAVCAGSCLFGILSNYIPVDLWNQGATNVMHNTSRIAAQVVSGIGFLGAGLMFREGDTTRGLTTAATMWASAAIGLAVSYELYIIAILATLMIFFILIASHTKMWPKVSPKRKKI